MFLNHAEKTVRPGSFKDICLLCLETKENKPNPSLQINSSKLKACGNVYYGVLYFLGENVCARRDLTDRPTQPLAAALKDQDGSIVPSEGPPSFMVTAGSGRQTACGGKVGLCRRTALKDLCQPVPGDAEACSSISPSSASVGAFPGHVTQRT